MVADKNEVAVLCCLNRYDVARQPGDAPAHQWLILSEQPPVLSPTLARILVALGLDPIQEVLVSGCVFGASFLSAKAIEVYDEDVPWPGGNVATIPIDANMTV